METTYYVKVTGTGRYGRKIEFNSEQAARAFAADVRNLRGIAVDRVDVCRASGRIVAAWDREGGKWTRTI